MADLERRQESTDDIRVEDVQQENVRFNTAPEAISSAESDEGPELIVEAVKLLKESNSGAAEKLRNLLNIKKEEEPNEEQKAKLKKLLEDAGIDVEDLKNLDDESKKEEILKTVIKKAIKSVAEKTKELGTIGTDEELMKKVEEETNNLFEGMPKIQKDFAKYLVVHAKDPAKTAEKVTEVVLEKGSEYAGEKLRKNTEMLKEIGKNAYPTKENVLLNLMTGGARSAVNLTNIVTENAIENAFMDVKAAKDLTKWVTEEVVKSKINSMSPLWLIKSLPSPDEILNDLGIDPAKKEEEIRESLKKLSPNNVAKNIVNFLFK